MCAAISCVRRSILVAVTCHIGYHFALLQGRLFCQMAAVLPPFPPPPPPPGGGGPPGPGRGPSKHDVGPWVVDDEEEKDEEGPEVDTRYCYSCHCQTYLRKGNCLNKKCDMPLLF